MIPHPVVQKVAATIKRHRMTPPGARLLAAVSGGADSVCLAQVLITLGYPLGIAHVNYRLRGSESDGDEEFVRRLADSLGAACFVRRARVGEWPGNLESGAREIRRSFFREVLDREGFRQVALAHSSNDRIETLFLHLLRGSGSGGLASMGPVSGRTLRPLIETSRVEVEAYLTAIGQTWRTDASNRDLRFARNRIRHQVLPALRSAFNPQLEKTLARTAEILSAEHAWMEEEARSWVSDRFSAGGTDAWSLPGDTAPRLDIGALGSRPVGFVRRVLRAALEAAGSDLKDVGFDHIEQLRGILRPGGSGKVIRFPGAISVERSFDTLVFRKGTTGRADYDNDYEYELPIPGRVRVQEAGLWFEARILDRTRERGPGSPTRVAVDGETLGPYVKIRNWKSGDTYDPAGLPKAKVKTLFQAKRIPRSTRIRWPVCVARSSIVWVASFPVSHEYVPTERSRRIIELEASPFAV